MNVQLVYEAGPQELPDGIRAAARNPDVLPFRSRPCLLQCGLNTFGCEGDRGSCFGRGPSWLDTFREVNGDGVTLGFVDRSA